MRIRLLISVLLAVALAGCESDACLVTGEPPLPLSRTALPPANYQRVKPADRTPLPAVSREEPRQEPRKEVAAKLRRVAAGDAAWVAGTPTKWTHIIIHHSAMEFGNAAVIDRQHRQQKWDELGYHFVIANGNGGVGGAVEVGSRWTAQKHGAHCRPDPNDANYWNEHGIGICLVGNFENHRPSAAQMASAARLVAFLMDECGIPRKNVLGHGQVPGAQTACPGQQFSHEDLFCRIEALPRN